MKTIRGYLSGFSLDDQDQLLYVVSNDRVWGRLDLADKEMRSPDSEPREGQRTIVKHRVSKDEKQMAIL